MLRKSGSALVLFVMFFLVFGPVTAAQAQSSNTGCPPFNPARVVDDLFLQSLSSDCAKPYLKFADNLEAGPDSIIPQSAGGPDTFGYTYDDTVPFSWVPAATDTGLTGDDVVSDPFEIGFNFPFYGLNYSQLYFNTNGGITFGAGSDAYGISTLPLPSAPNNLIAPFWGDLVVHNYKNGNVVNDGAIYYTQGGSAPNRYLILEWRDVETYKDLENTTFSPFSFEVILYENGNILAQIQSLPTRYDTTIGIENSLGDDGLLYQKGDSGLSASKAIRFSYPAGIARVQVSPLYAGQFSVIGQTNQFELKIANTGSLGADTYDLAVVSPWTTSLYAANGSTPLTDTDGDTKVDTGPVPQSASVTIIVKITTPISAVVGNANLATLTATSSLDTGKSKTSTMQNSVPAPFAQIYRDDANGAMSIQLVYPDAQTLKTVTPDEYFGYGNEMSVAVAPNGNYVYVWSKGRCLDIGCSTDTYEIEYAILDHFGNTVHPYTKLADNSSAVTGAYHRTPSVVVAPNGTIGIIWQSHLFTSSTSNYNIYLATLDGSGNLQSGPTNLTNNTDWVPTPLSIVYAPPVVTASDDNHFTMAWEINQNLWYAVRDSGGVNVFSPAALTVDSTSSNPVLNSLKNGKTIITWASNKAATYAILNSDGSVSKSAATLGTSYYPYTDAVLMPNGKVAVAWIMNKGVQYATLNSSTYVLESGPSSASNPFSLQGKGLSVTTDSSNDVILTWSDVTTAQNLFYALGNSTGTFVTQPMLYISSSNKIYTSFNGQGNAPLKLPASVVSVTRASVNPSPASSVNFTVTFSDPVTGVDVTDFSLTSTGLSSPAVSGISGSASLYTVTVNTGSGNGTLRLDVVDDDTILDSVGNSLGGPGEDNGNYPSGESYAIDKTAPTLDSFTAPTPSKSFNIPITAFTGSDNAAVTGYMITTSATPPSASAAGWIGTAPATYTVPTVGSFTLYPWVKDAAGNISAAFPTPRTVVVDLPIVARITRAVVNPTKATSVKYTVTFNKTVTGVDKTDFALVSTGGITKAVISSVSGKGTTYLVTVGTGTGLGTLRLDVVDNDSIKDAAGTALGGASAGNGTFNTGEIFTVDKVKPIVLSIVRAGASPTTAASVNYTVTLSEPVTGVDVKDFKLTLTGGIIGTAVTSVTSTGATTYNVAVNTGTSTGLGTLRLDLAANNTIKDPALNILTTSFKTGEVYTVDKAPVVLSILRASPTPTKLVSVKFTVKFSEAVRFVDAADFITTNVSGTLANTTVLSVIGSGTTWTVTVGTGTGSGILRLDLIDNNSILDAKDKKLGGDALGDGNFTTGLTYTVAR